MYSQVVCNHNELSGRNVQIFLSICRCCCCHCYCLCSDSWNCTINNSSWPSVSLADCTCSRWGSNLQISAPCNLQERESSLAHDWEFQILLQQQLSNSNSSLHWDIWILHMEILDTNLHSSELFWQEASVESAVVAMHYKEESWNQEVYTKNLKPRKVMTW